jgi:beta-glucosidase
MMKGTMDFMAVNYYTSSWVKAAPFDYTKEYEGPPLGYSAGDTGPDGVQMPYVSATSWASYFPSGIRGLCKAVHDKYQLDIWISESGTSVKGELTMSKAEIVDDKVRQGFFEGVTTALGESIAIDKVPVKAFLAWSLLDNFEWLTYDQRFGLVSVERGDDMSRNNTLTRTVKNSFIWLKDHFASNAKSPFSLPNVSTGAASGKMIGSLVVLLSMLVSIL